MSVPSEEVDPPFMPAEMSDASRKLKNNNAISPDAVHIGYIKYGANEVFLDISNISNKTIKTGNFSEDI